MLCFIAALLSVWRLFTSCTVVWEGYGWNGWTGYIYGRQPHVCFDYVIHVFQPSSNLTHILHIANTLELRMLYKIYCDIVA